MLLGQIAAARVGNPIDKLVLVMMARIASPDGRVAPTWDELVAATELSRKTVRVSIRKLREAGWLIDTGDRAGGTSRVVVYRLNILPTTNGALTETPTKMLPIGKLRTLLNGGHEAPIKAGIGSLGPAEIGTHKPLLRPSRSTESSSTESLSKNILYKLPTPVQPENPISTTTRETEKSEPANPQADNTLTLTPPPVSAAKPQRSSPRPKAALTQIPDTWEPSEKGLAFAAQRGVIAADEAPRFVAHHQQKGSLMASWDAAWRTWCLNQERWRKEDAAKARGVTARDVAQGESYRPSELRTAL